METDERNRHVEETGRQARSGRPAGGTLRNRRRAQEAGTHTEVGPEDRDAPTEHRADRAIPRNFTRPEKPEVRGREVEEPIEFLDEPDDYEDYDQEEEEHASGGWRVWAPVVLLILAALILAGAIFKYTGVFSRPDQARQPEAREAKAPRPDAPAASADITPEDAPRDRAREIVHESGLTFSQSETGEKISVRNGEKSWEGVATAEGRGEFIRLEGPTAGEFKSGFDTPEGSVTFGTFASYEPATGKLEHATLHRLTVSEEDKIEEITEGSFYVVEDGQRFSGTYVDERPEGGKKVARSYTLRRSAGVERCFEVTFEAKPGTLIPDLVDWREGLDAPKCG